MAAKVFGDLNESAFPSAAGVRLPGRGVPSILGFFPPTIRGALSRLPAAVWQTAEEIRLRARRPLTIAAFDRDLWVTPQGTLATNPGAALQPSAEDIATALQLMCQGSIYAREEELRGGFLTLAGGYRVGIAGHVVADEGMVKTIHPVSSLAVRLPREIPGLARSILPFLLTPARGDGRYFLSTLIISRPRGGKTTMLRDLVRLLSSGDPPGGWPGARVALIDERSEVACSDLGVPQCDVGWRTDVLDACPKAAGLMLAIRTLAPQIVATDEIGTLQDVAAIQEAAVAGVSVLATAHASTRGELLRRPGLGQLVADGVFQRLVIISRRHGPGTVEAVLDEQGEALFSLEQAFMPDREAAL